MKLKSLEINLQRSWQANAGRYMGKITYDTPNLSEITVVLDPEVSEKVLGFIGPVITATAIKVHASLQADLQQSITEASQATVLEITNETHP